MFPDIEEMHTSNNINSITTIDSKYIRDWVEYSAFDAEITYFLRETLVKKLMTLKASEEDLQNNYDLYVKYWRPFGEALTDMERIGFKVDIDYLKV